MLWFGRGVDEVPARAAELQAAVDRLQTTLSAHELPESVRHAVAQHLAEIETCLAQIGVRQRTLPQQALARGGAWLTQRLRQARGINSQAWRLAESLIRRVGGSRMPPNAIRCLGFKELLKHHLESGTRASGPNRPWTVPEFAIALSPNPSSAYTDESARKSIRSWLNGSGLPSAGYFAKIEAALFGPPSSNGAPERSDARAMLRRAWERDKERRKQGPARWADVLSDRRARLVAAAASLVALVWLIPGGVPRLAPPLPLAPERDISGFFGPDDLLRSARFITFDCGLSALEQGGFDRFKQSDRYLTFANALAFRERGLVPAFLAGLANGSRTPLAPEAEKRLKSLALSVADAFSPLLFGAELPAPEFERIYASALDILESAVRSLGAEGISVADWRSDQEKEEESANPAPSWCTPQGEGKLSAEQFRDLVKNARSVFGLVAGLYIFGDAMEKATNVAEKAKLLFPGDMNVNGLLADLLALRREDGQKLDPKAYDRVFGLEDAALKRALLEQKIADRFSPAAADGIDADIKRHLTDRYRRAVLDIGLHIAFLQANESPRDGWMFGEVFIADNMRAFKAEYESTDDRKLRRFPCVDTFMGARILDTYAVFKLTALVRNGFVDLRQVTEAMGMLVEAKSLIERVDENRCFWNGPRKRLWLARVERHLRWAASLRDTARPA